MVNEIICAGDSLTGWKVYDSNEKYWPFATYPRFLQEQITEGNNSTRIINAGFDGFESDMADSIAAEYLGMYPDSRGFVMFFGINDLLKTKYTANLGETVVSHLNAAAKRVINKNKLPFVINMPRYISPGARQFNKILADSIEKGARIIDISSKLKPAHLEDGVHTNELGARAIAKEVYRALGPIL